MAMRMYTYLDRNGREQGPFPMRMLEKWMEKGYFDGNLKVRENGRGKWSTLQDELVHTPDDMEVVEVLERHRHTPVWMLDDDAHPMEGVTLELDIEERREQAPVISSTPDVPLVCVVLDTNIVLTHLTFVQSLKERYKPMIQVVAVVPWIVVCELDGLKSSTKGEETGPKVAELARNAIRCLKESATRPDGFMFVQTLAEFREGAKKLQKFTIESHVNNDDRILQCCIHYQQNMNEGSTQNQGADFGAGVILLSNDANLCVKALANGVSAMGLKDFPSCAEDLLHAAESTALGVEAPTLREDESCQTLTTTEGIIGTGSRELIEEAVEVFERVYNDVCLAQFQRAMGELWVDVIEAKPPWQGRDIVSFLRRHWNAVFRDVMQTSLLKQIDVLDQIFRKHSRGRALEGTDVLKCIDAVEQLVVKVPTEHAKLEVVVHGQAKILKLHVVALLLLIPRSQKRVVEQSKRLEDPNVGPLLQDLDVATIQSGADGQMSAARGLQIIQMLPQAVEYQILALRERDPHALGHRQHLGSSQSIQALTRDLQSLSGGIADACKVLSQSDAAAKDFERVFSRLGLLLNTILTNTMPRAVYIAPHEIFLFATSSPDVLAYLSHCMNQLTKAVEILQEWDDQASSIETA